MYLYLLDKNETRALYAFASVSVCVSVWAGCIWSALLKFVRMYFEAFENIVCAVAAIATTAAAATAAAASAEYARARSACNEEWDLEWDRDRDSERVRMWNCMPAESVRVLCARGRASEYSSKLNGKSEKMYKYELRTSSGK